MNIIKLINNLRMISKICAVGAFAVGFLALCEYFGGPEGEILSYPIEAQINDYGVITN